MCRKYNNEVVSTKEQVGKRIFTLVHMTRQKEGDHLKNWNLEMFKVQISYTAFSAVFDT